MNNARETMRIGSDEAVVLVGSEESAGAVLVLEVTIPAGGGPPVLHRHPPSELYRIESGELTLYVEDAHGAVRRSAASAGELVHIPASRLHTVRNETPEPARATAIFAPGAEIEQFFREAAALSAQGQVDPADVLRIAERHGITFGEGLDGA